MCKINFNRVQIFPWMVFLIMLSMCLSLNGSAIAAEGEGCPNNTPPSGTYKNSCNTIKCVGVDLDAHCKKMSGSWNESAELTNFNNCVSKKGDITNCDGDLRCTCGTSNYPCPSGSYKNSCFCCSINPKWNETAQKEQKQLACWCRDKKGKYSRGETTLDNYEGCKKMSNDSNTYTIWNSDGYLKCDR